MTDPYYQHGGITIYHGDCYELLDDLTFDLIVTDPPYGINIETDFRPMNGTNYAPVAGDDQPFDPTPILAHGPALLFGIDHYAGLLPPHEGTFHVWDKRVTLQSNVLADCEFYWSSWQSGPTRIFRHKWQGHIRDSEHRSFLHPTMKPLSLMLTILSEPRTPAGVVLDPFAGSGTTLRAAKDLGRKAIGIEIDERYCEIAVRRLGQEVLAL